MKALVFSDPHVGHGLDHGRTRAERLDDQEQTLARIAAVAVEQEVDVVLFGGDMFEGPGVPSSHYIRVRRALCAPLADAGIPIVGISGNQTHDSAGNEGEHNALAVLHDPGRFDVYTRAALHVVDNGFGTPLLVVACVPWASTSRLRAMLNGAQVDDVNDTAAGHVIALAEGLRAHARAQYPGLPCVLVSHFSTTGWKTPTGLPTDDIRDIVLPIEELERLDFDAVFMGHVHAPGEIAPEIVSLSSPLCLNFGEEHIDHGVWLWDSALGGEFVPLRSRPFVTLDWDVGEVEALLDLPGPPATRGWTSVVDDAIVRLRFSAEAGDPVLTERAAIERALLDAGAHAVWKIEPHVERQSRARVAGVTEHLGPLEALALYDEAHDTPPDVAFAVRRWVSRQLEEIAA